MPASRDTSSSLGVLILFLLRTLEHTKLKIISTSSCVCPSRRYMEWIVSKLDLLWSTDRNRAHSWFLQADTVLSVWMTKWRAIFNPNAARCCFTTASVPDENKRFFYSEYFANHKSKCRTKKSSFMGTKALMIHSIWKLAPVKVVSRSVTKNWQL